MEKHAYRITVEHLAAPHGEKTVQEPMRFEVSNRDNLFIIAEHLKHRKDVAPENAEAFAVGLKLFSSVLLEQKDLPVFETILPQFANFMKELKKIPA